MQQTGTKFKEITLDELKKRLNSEHPPVLINTLSEEYFAQSHGLRLPNSHWIPVAELEQKAKLLFGLNREIVVYCAGHGCTASEKAAEKLQSLGYTNVWLYEGGVKEWQEAGLPLESNEQQANTGCCGSGHSCG